MILLAVKSGFTLGSGAETIQGLLLSSVYITIGVPELCPKADKTELLMVQ